MKFISAHSWGAHPTTLSHIYKAYIRSTLEYASFIFHDESKNKNQFQKLNVIQNNALRTISGCFKTTPINILHHICGINYLNHRREFLTKKFILKNFAVIDNTLFPKLLYLSQLISQKPNSYSKMSYLFKVSRDFLSCNIVRSRLLPTFTIPYSALFIDHHVILNNLNVEKNPIKALNSILNSYLDFKIIFTDGSKSING